MDAIQLLENDHRTVEKLFAEFESESGERRHAILGEIIRELSIHTAIEEAYVYPRIAREVPNGSRFVDEGEKEHHKVKEECARLDGRIDKAHTQEVASLVETLKKNVQHHVDEEETEVFPAFRQVATQQELNEIGKQLRAAKDSAPTRPHPNQPSGSVVTNWANGLVDRARDAVGGRAR